MIGKWSIFLLFWANRILRFWFLKFLIFSTLLNIINYIFFFQPINKIFDFYFFFQTLEITKEEEEEEEEEIEDAINFALQLYYTIFETHARSFIRSKANRLGIAWCVSRARAYLSWFDKSRQKASLNKRDSLVIHAPPSWIREINDPRVRHRQHRCVGDLRGLSYGGPCCVHGATPVIFCTVCC